MVDIIYICLRVDQLNQILDDFDNILFCQYSDVHVRIKIQLLVDTITTYVAQVITLFREEQVIDNFTCTSIISRICITQLTIDIKHGFFFRVTRVFLKSIENNRIIRSISYFVVNQDTLHTRFQNQIDMLWFQNSFTVDNYLITFDSYNFTGILINEVFCPCLQNTSCQFTSDDFLQVGLVNLNVFCQIKDFKNIFIVFKTYGTQQCSYRKLLLTVDISIHHVIDIGRKFNPRTFERDNTCRIQFSTVGMNALSEEHTWRTVQLRNYNTFCSVNNESTFRSHIRDSSQINILNYRIEVFMIGVGTIKLKLSFQGNTISQSTLQAFIDRIVRRVDIVIKELEHEVVTSICDREILGKHFVQAIVLSFFRRGI